MSSGEAKQTPKVVNYERIPEKLNNEVHPIYDMLRGLINGRVVFNHLVNATIGICWQTDCKPGPDGIMQYGKATILSDFMKEFMLLSGGKNPKPFDAIVVLNKDWWMQEAEAEGSKATTDLMRLGLLNHVLLQIRSKVGVDGEQKVDERNRKLFRKAQPDFMIFTEEIQEGPWNYEQESTYQKVLQFEESLFNISGSDSQTESGVAGSVGPASKQEPATKAAI